MAEIFVVGAGLSGLTAAINCARAGHEVTVIERFPAVGGLPRVHPGVDATPMDPAALGRFIGIDLKPPYVVPTERITMYIYGKKFEMPGAKAYLHSVERGSRSAALDHYLYETALREEVKFEFNRELRTEKEYIDLPPRSIIATGLRFEPFSLLGIPCVQLYGWVVKGRSRVGPCVKGWFDRYTRDYCYYADCNGIAFGLCFARARPVGRDARERWAEQLREQEGIEFPSWEEHEGAAPARSLQNPRLFWRDKILSGSLSGMQDPVMLFGVHGALVSGKVSALAVDDKEKAYRLFDYFTRFFRYSMLAWRAVLYSPPHPLRSLTLRAVMGSWTKPSGAFGSVMDLAFRTIPGFRKLKLETRVSTEKSTSYAAEGD